MELQILFAALAALGPWGHELDRREIHCLAQTVYNESRGQSDRGQKAVAHVVLNRVGVGRFPDSICGVVYQPKQFSWTLPQYREIRERKKDLKAWSKAVRIAIEAFYSTSLVDPSKGSIYFYEPAKVAPKWAQSYQIVMEEGAHRFMQ